MERGKRSDEPLEKLANNSYRKRFVDFFPKGGFGGRPRESGHRSASLSTRKPKNRYPRATLGGLCMTLTLAAVHESETEGKAENICSH
jgi:hypothetical protein